MKVTIDSWQLTYCNNTTYVVSPATWDSETGKVTGPCVKHEVVSRLFHCSSAQTGASQGKEVTLPFYKEIASENHFRSGFYDECYV